MRVKELLTEITRSGVQRTKKIKRPDGTVVSYYLSHDVNDGFSVFVESKDEDRTLSSEHYPEVYYYDLDNVLVPKLLPMIIKYMEKVTDEIGSTEYYKKFENVVEKVFEAHVIYAKYIHKGNTGKIDAMDELSNKDLEDYIDL